MTREEAIEILIAVAVCDRPILSCDFCARYVGMGTDCTYPSDKEIEESVLFLKGASNDAEISALRQQDVADKDVGKWISVKDRLPDYMGEVLVIVSGKPHENITLDGAYEIAEYDPVEGWILEMWPEWCSGVVTHWMPLPEPPEDGTV